MSGGIPENSSEAKPLARPCSANTASARRPSREMPPGRPSYAVRTRATRRSRASGATARSTSLRNAESRADSVPLLKISVNEGGFAARSCPISRRARPDSVSAGMPGGSSGTRVTITGRATAIESAEAISTSHRRRYTNRPHRASTARSRPLSSLTPWTVSNPGGSDVHHDFQGVAEAFHVGAERVVDLVELEVVGDDRVGHDLALAHEGERAAGVHAALAPRGVDAHVAAHREV